MTELRAIGGGRDHFDETGRGYAQHQEQAAQSLELDHQHGQGQKMSIRGKSRLGPLQNDRTLLSICDKGAGNPEGSPVPEYP